jgi:hypothetical protein
MKKHILIGALALAFCLGFAVPAFADNPPGTETVPSITVNIADVPGLTATMTNVHDHYVESLEAYRYEESGDVSDGYNLTFSFGDDGGTIGFNRDVVIFGFEYFHMDESEYAKINLKAGDTVKFGGAWDGFFLYTDGTKNITEKPDWTDENYRIRGVAFDSYPMLLGLTDETMANEDFNKRSIYDISASAPSAPPAAPATPASPAANTLSAKPTASPVLVNGKQIAFDAYNISGNNYFKLRDLAYALNGTEKQFEVGWDGAANAIALTSGKAYTAVGGEMTGKGAGDKTATPTSSKITLNGGEVSLTAYNIGGNNYFKLRDLGQEFDFGVDWDGANNTIVIDTSKGYTPE